MLDNFSTVLETHPIDWCYNCAYSYLRDNNANTEKKLFCLAFVQYARLVIGPLTKLTSFEFLSEKDLRVVFDSKVFRDWDIEAVAKIKYKPKYYTFLYPLLREHVMSFAKVCIDIKSCKATFDEDKNLIITMKLQ